ncbi:malonic semialdehyde reductase [Cupriavidus sp. CV2]|uniref:malonic semialdehyde reductase n=1 Tax=Cupriavidus ulmosensis TaxID=3065913 RepID=UPI00296B565F|nr:malonic semialdehyde reductase [Cupriavidus sp. CV2]MDW3683735.1 malonic semialdehyde reductase [Cupriavidus sp. CV2]
MSTHEMLATLFSNARSQNGWRDRSVSDAQLREIYEQMKWGPTSVNCSPARIVFVRTQEAKLKLKDALAPANIDKVMNAPVVAIVGYDTSFYKNLPELFPHNPSVKTWFEGEEKAAFAEITAFRNGTLQGAYLIMAARAVGLDCGPMSGFNNAAVDAAFFAGTTIKSNFICGLGHGDPAKVFARSPRLSFEQACTLA